MEWVLRSPQIHSIFSNLGYLHSDGYHVNENCNAALEAILVNILSEDKHLRTYRRSISFGENIKKDLIPLLIHAKEDRTIELLTRILVNLTIPIECLLSVEIISKNDFGRHTIFEINNLLASIKVAFTDHRATRVIIDFMKKNVDLELKAKLLPQQCSNVSNSLMLLRNILHIPERREELAPAPLPTLQNQILWNMFSQSIDKLLIQLMSIPDAYRWGVTMVQLIALLYKDQHVVTLHKLLNAWLETTLTESSEDDESNTPPDRGDATSMPTTRAAIPFCHPVHLVGSDDSSPVLTSDPTSDSSDTGGKSQPSPAAEDWQASSDNKPDRNGNGPQASIKNDALDNVKNDKQDNVKNNEQDDSLAGNETIQNSVEDSTKIDSDTAVSCTSGTQSEQTRSEKQNNEKKTGVSETSDYGYGTQMENQESNSTSSNDYDRPSEKPVHQKPRNPKQRANSKDRTGLTPQERKRKKILKREESNIINVQGLNHKTPTDEDLSNVLKEFTVDFLLKGYNMLVQTLHGEILADQKLEIDKSHFFWLITYFLKFAAQIELDLERVRSVLSFEIVSYLTAEGVYLCEQFELAIKLDGENLTPTIRRLHLVVTAIREFVQATQKYKMISSNNKEDMDTLMKLQIKMCESDELRELLLLLIRHYNPKFHSKQYLQDLIVTNHTLLMFLDKVMKLPEYTGSATMVDHLRQFATPEVMYQYGELLEDYDINEEYVNDCIFTVMHHVVGDLDSINTMYQPKLLKTFTAIWRSDFEMCDDWVDVVEYVVNKFIRKPNNFQSFSNFLLKAGGSDDELLKLIGISPSQTKELNEMETKNKKTQKFSNNTSQERWTEDEISSLNWTYLQCKTLPDVVGGVIKMLREDGIIKSKESIIKELYRQNTITRDEYKKFLRGDSDKPSSSTNKDMRDDDIAKLCTHLAEDGKAKFLDWVQKVLLDTCHAKIYLDKKKSEKSLADESKLLNFEVFKKKADEMPVLSAVSYHSLYWNQSVPLVPWNSQQAAVCKDLRFLQLLHKLGFHMPVDSGKVFIRIPNFWTADILFDVAKKISPIDTSKLKFSVSDLGNARKPEPDYPRNDCNDDPTMGPTNYYQVHQQTHFATTVNFTPMPGCSYNSEASGIDHHNWLNVVQKSQEFKLTLNSESPAESEHVEGGDGSPRAFVKTATVAEASYTTMMSGALLAGGAPLLLPTIMTVKQEISTYSEYYNNASTCETASVASDLTRMYVSDEEDKLDDGVDPDVAAPDTDGELDEHDADRDADADCCSARPRKRRRVSFAQPF